VLDERATFLGQWGLRGARGSRGPSYEELVETEGRPRLRYWLDRLQTEAVLEAAVVYGYFPCHSKGEDLMVLNEDGSERVRFSFPRQRRDPQLWFGGLFPPEGARQNDGVGVPGGTLGNRRSGRGPGLVPAGE